MSTDHESLIKKVESGGELSQPERTIAAELMRKGARRSKASKEAISKVNASKQRHLKMDKKSVAQRERMRERRAMAKLQTKAGK